MARERGHGESSHVVWIGRQGIKDWDLLKIVLAGDWTLVTRDAYDFRGPKDAPGSGGQFNTPSCMRASFASTDRKEWTSRFSAICFEAVLDEIDRDGDLVNMILEVTLETIESDEIIIDRYALPTDAED